MNTKTKRYLPTLTGLALGLVISNAYPCTNLQMTGYIPGGKIVVSARTMDFGFDLQSQFVFVPRNQSWTSSALAGAPAPVTWKNTHGFVGINLLDINTQYADGLNEAGLSAAFLWLDEAQFPVYPKQAGVALSIRDVVSYLLGQYTTAAEAKAALSKVVVWGEYSPEIKMIPPVHLVVEDATGDSFVVEWIKGKQHIYDPSNTKNYQAVLTNSPPYLGQLQNFKSYAKQSCMDIRHNKGGLARLPGNSDSKPRFVRSVLLSRCAQYDNYSQQYLLQGEPDAVNTAFQVIGRMETPIGEAIEREPREFKGVIDWTQWSIVRVHGGIDGTGHSTSKLYVRSSDNQSLRELDFSKFDFGGDSVSSGFSVLPIASDRYKPAEELSFP